MKKNKIFISVFNWITFILFPICIYISIKWCNLPIINLPFGIEKVFLKPDNVDSIMSSLATGYVSGYMVYILTVIIPSSIRNRPMQLEAAKKLSIIYRRAILIILLMCKNVCTKEQWPEVIRESDFDCFNDRYYFYMQLFDLKGEAETMLLHKDTMQPLRWYEYLEFEFENMQKDLDETFIQFHAYIKDDMLKIITDLKNCHFFGMFTGNSVNMDTIATDKDGYVYFETFAMSNVYSQKGEKNPIFSKTDKADNSTSLREFISLLESLYDFLSKFPKGVSVERDFAVSRLKNDKVGHYNTALWNNNTNRI